MLGGKKGENSLSFSSTALPQSPTSPLYPSCGILEAFMMSCGKLYQSYKGKP